LARWADEFRLRKELHFTSHDLEEMESEQYLFYCDLLHEADLKMIEDQRKQALELKNKSRR